MNEESVTLTIIKWLTYKGWQILCYDFPQSGMGKMLHPNISKSKNDGAIIPDIVAIKGNVAVYFENKDALVIEDFYKVNRVKSSNDYSSSFDKLIGTQYTLFMGIGLPMTAIDYDAIKANSGLVDFVVACNEEGCIVIYDKHGVFNDCGLEPILR